MPGFQADVPPVNVAPFWTVEGVVGRKRHLRVIRTLVVPALSHCQIWAVSGGDSLRDNQETRSPAKDSGTSASLHTLLHLMLTETWGQGGRICPRGSPKETQRLGILSSSLLCSDTWKFLFLVILVKEESSLSKCVSSRGGSLHHRPYGVPNSPSPW